MLAFLVPLSQFARGLYHRSNWACRRYSDFPDHASSHAVKEIAIRVLEEEKPPLVKNGGARKWVYEHIRVVHDPLAFNFTIGVRGNWDQFYVVLKEEQVREEILPWLVAHELSHLLNQDRVRGYMRSGAVAIVAAAVTSVFLGVWAACGATWLCTMVYRVMDNHRVERRADQFANRVTSDEVRHAALVWFRELNGQLSPLAKMVNFFTHPPIPYRAMELLDNL